MSETAKTPTTGEYMRVADLAKHTRISAVTWNRLRHEGTGPKYLKLQKIVLYRRADVDAWLAARQTGSTSERPQAGAGDAR